MFLKPLSSFMSAAHKIRLRDLRLIRLELLHFKNHFNQINYPCYKAKTKN